MSAQLLARELFALPGAPAERTRHLLALAAGAHARLLHSTANSSALEVNRLRGTLENYLKGSAPPAEKRELLDDPLFVEALHALAGASAELADWDSTVAPGCNLAADIGDASLGCARLGNVVAAVRLRRRRQWCGQMELASDEFGRVHLPFCDWALVLVRGQGENRELLAHQRVLLTISERKAEWALASLTESVVLRMSRDAFDDLFVDNRPSCQANAVEFCGGPVTARFERATKLAGTRIGYEPIAADAPTTHAALTGGIVMTLLAAIQANSPAIYQQLGQCIRTIRGFELPDWRTGQIASFSVPTSPGVIGFNVQFTDDDQPRLDPYCFMWLGHELGHTLHYLIEDIAFAHGWRFLENPGDLTPVLARYGRSLRVRTLLQIPYVHLFEWRLLMGFMAHDFAGLPWRMFDDAMAVGNDVRQEIFDSFEWIEEHARLTLVGKAVIDEMRRLVEETDEEWRRVTAVKQSFTRFDLASST